MAKVFARERRRRRKDNNLLGVETRSVRSLVEREGPVETAAVRGRVSDDKKILKLYVI